MHLPHQSLASIRALADVANHPLLLGILRGIEKEGLRASPQGFIAQTPHPTGLGSALHHPLITTDYSEALLEFITPPSHRLDALFQCLDDIHYTAHRALKDETLWCNSMPCELDGDTSIPIAQYGSSNRGRMKSIYRMGLGHRYGRVMQTVAGIHYNFSLPQAFWAFLQQQEESTEDLQDFISRRYFDLIRNFRRHYWLLIYLFGASPVLSSSFVQGRNHNLEPLPHNPNTFHLPYATSLRMGDLGYQSSAQEALYVCYNSARSYSRSLVEAINTPFPDYQRIGLRDAQGDYLQLNAGLLQIENEFYSAIRPKRTARAGETALTALCSRGVEYIEIRCLDINPFEGNGLAKEQIRFIDAFLLYCLLSPSADANRDETQRVLKNQKCVVTQGRHPAAQIISPDNQPQPLLTAAKELLDAIEPLAELLDKAHESVDFSNALKHQIAKVVDPDLTPSSAVLTSLQASQATFSDWVLSLAQSHRHSYLQQAIPISRQDYFAKLAQESLNAQKIEEAEPQIPFDQYLQNYYAQYPACGQTGYLVQL